MTNQDSTPGPRQPSQPTYTVEPTETHKHTIIFLHGLGSNGEKFGQEFLSTGRTSSGLTLSALLPSTRFIFPTAKWRRSSAFGRKKLTAWSDVARLDDPSYRQETQLQGLAESAAAIRALLFEEVAHVGAGNVVLGGISNGCAMALSVLLSLEFALGGFFGMCGYLPFRKEIEAEVSGRSDDDGSNKAGERGDEDTDEDTDDSEDDLFEKSSNDGTTRPNEPALRAFHFERDLLCLDPLPDVTTVAQTASSTPVFLGHGDADEKKPYKQGEAAARTMRAAGYCVEWRLYAGLGHWYKIPDEIDDIAEFISKKVGWEMRAV
ncbi:acyl-protein thioesterase [Xylaria arbuscula]|nr:acyl-protein thioesterase [Xylaria arbuscula]